MKTIDKTRSTNTFCIGSVDCEHIVEIAKHFGADLIAVAHDPKASDDVSMYTVRTSNRATGIYDHRVQVLADIRVLETETIVDFQEFDRAKARVA